MSHPVLDTDFARHRMVDTQIRPMLVNDPRIIHAMREIPRERFLPPELAAGAYMDRSIPLGAGRVLGEPRVVARLVQSLVPRRGERALVVGAGTGYAAALLDRLGVAVVALEQDERLIAIGRDACGATALGVQYRQGPLSAGWDEGAPYDMILIDGGVRAIPPALAAQLKPQGRLACVLWAEKRVPAAVLAEASVGGVLRERVQFDANLPLLPELAPALAFSL
ncbi:protein-L-isoaspartate O-methyltransferase family protein [Rhizosaccharibacter radicis]|uniref:Protein-L-isoaspartate O-methyltransferase n=1 Tax=Rhizosaccharibacter radicis TaxID=2782605 RepID=A0ABT1VW90_9PROT|nr:protein-L-isoaspartate O-methyltransferase [Acetobacteraceae bacterium KSS12]